MINQEELKLITKRSLEIIKRRNEGAHACANFGDRFINQHWINKYGSFNLRSDITRLIETVEVQQHAMDKLMDAINNEGISPETHRRTLRHHRLEWPTLWKAIQEISDLKERGG